MYKELTYASGGFNTNIWTNPDILNRTSQFRIYTIYCTKIEVYIIDNPDSSSTATAEAVLLSTDKL